MKKILIYYPFNLSSVAIESQAELLVKLGYEVFFLTWAPGGELHEACRKAGATALSSHDGKQRSGIRFFIYQAGFLAKFCRQKGIGIVLAHLQSVGMIAGFAKWISKLRVIYFRHNSDYFHLKKSGKDLFINRLANKLPDTIVAISDKVKEQLIKEGVKEKKVERINLCYNFLHYGSPGNPAAQKIREQYSCRLLLVSAGRLDPLKRFLVSFAVVKELLEKNIDVKLVCIGEGPQKNELLDYIRTHKLEERIFLAGFVSNVIDFISAGDIFVHLSYSEASSNVVKEAGFCKKPVIVCHGVGDFDEYLTDGKNAFLVDKEDPAQQTIKLLADHFENLVLLRRVGENLYTEIFSRFSIDAVINDYKKLLN